MQFFDCFMVFSLPFLICALNIKQWRIDERFAQFMVLLLLLLFIIPFIMAERIKQWYDGFACEIPLSCYHMLLFFLCYYNVMLH